MYMDTQERKGWTKYSFERYVVPKDKERERGQEQQREKAKKECGTDSRGRERLECNRTRVEYFGTSQSGTELDRHVVRAEYLSKNGGTEMVQHNLKCKQEKHNTERERKKTERNLSATILQPNAFPF